MFIKSDSTLQDEEEKRKKEQQLTRESSFISPAVAAGSSQTATNPNSSKSGLFTNLKSFLDANKEKTNQLASNISNDITGKANTEKTNLNNDLKGFQNTVEAGKKTVDDSYVNDVNAKAGNWSDSDYAGIRSYLSGGYSGPTEFSSSATNKLNELKSTVDNSGTLEGRNTLLKNYYSAKNQSQNQGENTLDSMLIGRDEGAIGTLTNLKNNVGSLADTAISNANSSAAGSVEQARKYNQDQANKLKTGLAGAYDSEIAKKDEAVKQAKANLEKDYNNLISQKNITIKGVEKVDPWADKVGSGEYRFTGFDGLDDQTLDASKYVQKGDIDWTNAISAQQQAKINALANILGRDQLTGNVIGSKTPIFDEEAYNRDLQALKDKQSLFQKTRDNALADLKTKKDAWSKALEDSKKPPSGGGIGGSKATDTIPIPGVGVVGDIIGKTVTAIENPQKTISTTGTTTTVNTAVDQALALEKARIEAENRLRIAAETKAREEAAAEARRVAEEQARAERVAAVEVAKRIAGEKAAEQAKQALTRKAALEQETINKAAAEAARVEAARKAAEDTARKAAEEAARKAVEEAKKVSVNNVKKKLKIR